MDRIFYLGDHERVTPIDSPDYRATLVKFFQVLEEAELFRHEKRDRRRVGSVLEEWDADLSETCGLAPFSAEMSERLKNNGQELETA